MQKFINFLLLLFLFSSCSQPKAPIINRGSVVYSKNFYQNKQSDIDKTPSTDSKNNSNAIIVVDSDTIYSISKKHNVALRDLINENNLAPPYILKVGSKINLPSSQYHQVISGETLYSISRKYGMNINNLISINSLKEPYGVGVGQKIKISNLKTAEKKVSVVYQKPESLKTSGQDLPDATKKTNTEPTIANKNNRFLWPTKGIVISKFGPKTGGLYNDGINIKANNGDSVKATEDGVVAYVGNELRGYGNLIIIKHSGGWISAYGHLDQTKVKRGSKVIKGQNIATIGSTGNVKSPQLYFGLRKGREAVNPQSYL